MNNLPIQKIYLMVVAILGLGVALLMGSWVGSGNIMYPAAVICASSAVVFLLAVGRHYWYLIPFSILAGLPAIPFGGRTIDLVEVSVAACSAIFLGRLALKRERLVWWRPTHAALILSFTWVCCVWLLNPTGFAIFGSDTIGARFYIQIALSFLAFLILASQRPTEDDLRRLLWIVFTGTLVGALYGVYSFFFLGGSEAESGIGGSDFEEYSWHQVISVPAIIIAYLIFAYHKPSQVFTFHKPLLPLLYIVAFVIASLSGKRMSILMILLAPLLSCLINKEYRYILVGLILGGTLIMGLLYVQASVVALPFTVQRSLSWLPGDWDPSLEHLGKGDKFRDQLRDLARHEIERNPLVGRGYATSLSEVLTGYNMKDFGSGLEYEQVIIHAASKNWHNRWLGYSADFGIPFAVLLAWLYLTGIVVAWRLTQRLELNTHSRVFAVFAFFWVAQQVVTSHTSGHTAVDALRNWWMYGLLFACYAEFSNIKNRSLLTIRRSALSSAPTGHLNKPTLITLPK